MKKYILAIITILSFTSCTTKQLTTQNKQTKLYNLLINTSNTINKKEAKELSISSIEKSKQLANDYNITTSPLFHNMLIHLNIKQKGFCYHYANDLLKYLNNKNYKSFNFKKIVTNKDGYFEHTAVAVLMKNIDLNNSIALDPWREAGELYFSKIKDDKKYKWSLR